MGCSPSRFSRSAPLLGSFIRCATTGVKSNRKTTPHEEEYSPQFDVTLRQILRVTPPIQIDIGSGVLPASDSKQVVIFVFGGPGSLKGTLTQELAEEFEFVTINVEDIVFSYLPLKMANTITNVVQMQELVRRDANVISLKWILQMISTKLSTSNSQRFVIDIVPELSSLLRSSAFSNTDTHNECLIEFDRKHNVLFALDLCIAEDRLIMESKLNSDLSNNNKILATNTTAKRSSSGSITTGVNDSNGDGRVGSGRIVGLSPEMNAFLRGVDEADKGRLEKRIFMYRKCSEPFLNYFRKTKRIIRMDLKVPNNEELVPTIRRILTDIGFGRNNDSIRVVLFVMDQVELEQIDLEYYRLRRINLLDVCHDTNETMAQQIRTIRKFIYRTAQPNENIAVDLKGLNNTDYAPSKRINFLEYHTTYLEFYIRNCKNGSPRSRCRMSFRSITSTSGEACLFPESMPPKLSLRIGYAFGEKLSYSETDTRAPSQLSGETGTGYTSGLAAPSFVNS